MSRFLHLHNKLIAKALFFFYVVWLMLHLVTNLKEMGGDLDYSYWGLSDMLINYQGGLVRRGLLGELMYRVYEVFPFNVGYFVLALIIATAAGCIYALYRICRSKSISPVLVFSGFTLQFLALAEVVGIRRDYLTLLLCLLSFWSYRKWIQSVSGKVFWLFLCQSAMVVAVLFHEGAWFYTTPLLCLHLLYWGRNQLQETWSKSVIRSLCFVCPIAIVMSLIYFHKGDMEVAQTIWHSWQTLFSQYPLQGTTDPDIGLSVSCLACTTMDFVNGCGIKLWGLTYWGWLPMFPLTIALFPLLIYLVTHVNDSCISMGITLRPINITLMTTIMVIQLCSMLPFFLFLSCDYGRLFCYWIFSTFFAYSVFEKDQHIFPAMIHRCSDRFQRWISASRFLCTPLGYVTILVLTPCNMVGGAALGAIPLYRMIHETPSLVITLF